MIKNYIKIAIRNILRNKAFSFINVTGLAIGIACVILISLWVFDEMSYDKFHEKGNEIYKVITKFHDNAERTWTASPFPLTPALFEQYPDIISYTRYWFAGSLVKYDDKAFFEDKIRTVDQNFLDMFSFDIIKGNKENALLTKNSIVITESIAKKFFDTEDAIGKVLNVREKHNLIVTAIIEDPPKNSIFDFTMLINMEHVPKDRMVSWAFSLMSL